MSCCEQSCRTQCEKHPYQQRTENPRRKVFEAAVWREFFDIYYRRGNGNYPAQQQDLKSLKKRIEKADLSAALFIAVAFYTEIQTYQRNEYRYEFNTINFFDIGVKAERTHDKHPYHAEDAYYQAVYDYIFHGYLGVILT